MAMKYKIARYNMMYSKSRFGVDRRANSVSAASMCSINPLATEFKIPPNPINAGDKMAAPRQNRCQCALHFIVLSYSRINYSKDFLMYDCDPDTSALTTLVLVLGLG